MKLDRIIEIIKSLKEEPTMSAGTGGFGPSADPKGPVAGYANVMDFRTRHGRKAKQQPIARIEAKKNVRSRLKGSGS